MTDAPDSSPPFDWPRISIVTPCYNMVDFVEATIRSVLTQDYPNLEYFVIDGGSTDGTVDVIRRYADQLDGWTSEPDDGMYHAIQEGLEQTTGEVMAWLNADDLYHPNALRAVGRIFGHMPDVRWLQGRPSHIDEHGCTVNVLGLQRWSKYDYYLGNFRWIQQESTFWRRDLWEQAGAALDPSFTPASDLELWTRFFRYAPLHVTNTLLGGFRLRSSGQVSVEQNEAYFEQAERALDRERQQLGPDARRVLRRLRWIERACRPFKDFRLLNVDGLLRYYSRAFTSLPPLIRFERSTQTFVKA